MSSWAVKHQQADDLSDASDPVSLAKKAVLLSQDYRLHEARECLQLLGDVESDRLLQNEIEKMEQEMAKENTTPVARKPVKFPLPDSVVAGKSSSGLGLFAAREFDAGDIVFSESPIGVVSDEHHGCINCLRPLAARNVIRPDGSIVKEIGAQQVENMFAECNIRKLEPVEDCCSEECAHAIKKKELQKKGRRKKDDVSGKKLPKDVF